MTYEKAYNIEKASMELLRMYSNLELSFIDCSSIAIAKMYNIDVVFTFDSDFEKVGLRAL